MPTKIEFSDWQAEQMKDPEYARLYKERAPAFEIQRALIAGRLALGLTVETLARQADVHPSFVAMLEVAMGDPDVSTLQRLAAALGMELHITFEKAHEGGDRC